MAAVGRRISLVSYVDGGGNLPSNGAVSLASRALLLCGVAEGVETIEHGMNAIGKA